MGSISGPMKETMNISTTITSAVTARGLRKKLFTVCLKGLSIASTLMASSMERASSLLAPIKVRFVQRHTVLPALAKAAPTAAKKPFLGCASCVCCSFCSACCCVASCVASFISAASTGLLPISFFFICRHLLIWKL